MKVVIYARPGNIFASMLALSFNQAGHSAVLRAKQRWSGEVEGCDLVLLHGVRRQGIIEAYSHVPVFIFESGYLKRVNNKSEVQRGHWQISRAVLNGMPDFDCPPDRFEKLNLKVEKAQKKKGYVLLLGQMPNDSALNGTDHKAWLLEQIEHYESNSPYPVQYRQHPKGGVVLDHYPSMDGDLADALSEAALVVCYNSTAGFQALLAGCPVVCDPCAPYYELSGEKCPTIAQRRAFFNRAAYGQWRVDETPQAVQFLINEWLPRCH